MSATSILFIVSLLTGFIVFCFFLSRLTEWQRYNPYEPEYKKARTELLLSGAVLLAVAAVFFAVLIAMSDGIANM